MVAFIGIAYLWSSVIWISCLLIFNVQGANQLFSVSLGAFGPAIAGVVVVRALNRETARLSIIGFLVGALAAIASCATLVLGLTGLKSELYVTAKQPTLSTYFLMVPIVTLSGFIYSHSLAKSNWSRAWFFKMLPDRQTLALSLGVLCFLPTILVCSNWMANALGMEVAQPNYLKVSAAVWMPAMFFKLFTVFFMTGGNEEHGWRGVLLPLVQNKIRPIYAALFIGMIWELWHAPLVFSGIYGDGNPILTILNRMITTVLLSYLLTFIFNVSSGSIFLCVLMHSCQNTQVNLFFGSGFANAAVLVVVIALVVLSRMWRKESGYHPAFPQPKDAG